jgi:hypothetical protein
MPKDIGSFCQVCKIYCFLKIIFRAFLFYWQKKGKNRGRDIPYAPTLTHIVHS